MLRKKMIRAWKAFPTAAPAAAGLGTTQISSIRTTISPHAHRGMQSMVHARLPRRQGDRGANDGKCAFGRQVSASVGPDGRRVERTVGVVPVLRGPAGG